VPVVSVPAASPPTITPFVPGTKLSQIAAATAPPADTDVVVGVKAPTTVPVDQLYTIAQLRNSVGGLTVIGVGQQLDLYVNGSTGSDSNNGLSAGTAFQTIQKAVDTIEGQYVITGSSNGGNIHVAPTVTYTSAVGLGMINGGGTVNIFGDPTAFTLTAASGPCFAVYGATWAIGTCNLAAPASSAVEIGCIYVAGEPGAVQVLSGVTFGTSNCALIACHLSGNAFVSGNFTFNGTFPAFLFAKSPCAAIDANHCNLTLSSDPGAGCTWLHAERQGFIHTDFITVTGTSSGAKISATDGSTIDCPRGLTSIPGATTGTVGADSFFTDGNFMRVSTGFQGDSGSGGSYGYVPPPAAGDAAAGKFLKADGTWFTPPGGSATPGGANTNVQYNNSGAFGGNAGFTYDGLGAIGLGQATETGLINLKGKTSGTVSLSVADAAGTWTMKLPTSAGTNLYVLQTDGAGNTSWVPQSGGGGMSIGGAVSGGTPTEVLYVGAGPVLAQASNFNIQSNNPNVVSGGSYLYNNVNALYGASATDNWFVGQAGPGTGALPSGNDNFAAGSAALAAATTGNNNVAVGSSALQAVVSGAKNTAVGVSALAACTGSSNTCIGYQAALNGTSLSSNVIIGNLAVGTGVCTGSANVAIGDQALKALTSGINNVGLGQTSGASITTGGNNFALGQNCLGTLIDGSSNIAIGMQALNNTIHGDGNIAIGSSAMLNATSAAGNARNTVIGTVAAGNLTTGTLNTCIGYAAGNTLTSGSQNTFIGASAGALAGGQTDTIVLSSGASVQYWSDNTNTLGIGIGNGATNYGSVSGLHNIGIGTSALAAVSSGANNIGIGYQAVKAVTTAGENVGIGMQALLRVTSAGNVGIGGNVSSGDSALTFLSTGTACVGVGAGAAASITTHSNVTALGYKAFYNGDASDCTCVGYQAGLNLSSGAGNTFVGKNAGGGVTTGSNNTVIGIIAGLAGGLANQIILSDGAGTTGLQIDVPNKVFSFQTTTIGALPTAGTKGRRAFVTDGVASPTFGATVGTTGTRGLPVFDDGTNWCYG
jgi:hypothetical protein